MNWNARLIVEISLVMMVENFDGSEFRRDELCTKQVSISLNSQTKDSLTL